jgi:hypothetical protein
MGIRFHPDGICSASMGQAGQKQRIEARMGESETGEKRGETAQVIL